MLHRTTAPITYINWLQFCNFSLVEYLKISLSHLGVQVMETINVLCKKVHLKYIEIFVNVEHNI